MLATIFRNFVEPSIMYSSLSYIYFKKTFYCRIKVSFDKLIHSTSLPLLHNFEARLLLFMRRFVHNLHGRACAEYLISPTWLPSGRRTCLPTYRRSCYRCCYKFWTAVLTNCVCMTDSSYVQDASVSVIDLIHGWRLLGDFTAPPLMFYSSCTSLFLLWCTRSCNPSSYNYLSFIWRA